MQAPEEHTARWLVRSTQNRQLLSNDTPGDILTDKLWERAEKAQKIGEIEFYLPASPGRKARKVKQEVRSRRVCLRPPQRTGRRLPAVEVNLILCTETRAPKGADKLQWLLLTSVAIDNAARALEIVQWYLCRWQIEIFFKILKSGCDIEELQFDTLSRAANCIALYMIVAWRILYLTMLGRHCPEMSSALVFDEKEWQSVYAVIYKKKPPKKAPALSAMIKMIAHLGGYLNRKHDLEPGPQVMWIGIQRMRDFAIAWEVFPALVKGNTYV